MCSRRDAAMSLGMAVGALPRPSKENPGRLPIDFKLVYMSTNHPPAALPGRHAGAAVLAHERRSRFGFKDCRSK